MKQVDACSEVCDTAIGKKNLSKMATLVLKEIRHLTEVKQILANSAAALKANKKQA